jgi:hypothetical protein
VRGTIVFVRAGCYCTNLTRTRGEGPAEVRESNLVTNAVRARHSSK